MIAMSNSTLNESQAIEQFNVEAPRFDEANGAWVLSRNSDILAACRTSCLALAGFDSTKVVKAPDEQAHRAMRAETLEALAPQQLRQWRDRLAEEAEALVEALPRERPVDLVGEYAQPLCLFLAAMATSVPMEEAERFARLAREVSEASAEPGDSALKMRAKAANVELRSNFSKGPEALRDSGFVALSQTLPCLLSKTWLALIEHSSQWQMLHADPALVEQTIEELLRFAGLVRVLYRVATADFDLNGLRIRQGARIILRISEGNRDGACFANPNQLDVTRRNPGHLSLGAGHHACVGANLIRMTMKQLTLPLVTRFETAEVTQSVEWQGGSRFLSPRSLWVSLHSRAAP